jgi:hypothetical protein
VSITQQGLVPCGYTILPPARSFDAGGGSAAFDVNATPECGWTPVSSAPWLTVALAGPRTGNGTVTYVVAPNADAAARTANVTAGNGTHTVTQAGAKPCEYSVSPVDFRECVRGGFERAVTVDTAPGCGWTAATNASWLSIASGGSGSGSGSIRFTFSSNYDAARQAVIEVRWPAPTAGQNVRVAQEGCLYAVSRDSFDVPAGGGDLSFDVYQMTTDPACGGPLQNACVWSAQSTAAWIAVVTSMPCQGDERVALRVAANGGATPRTATVTVKNRTVTVRQAGI